MRSINDVGGSPSRPGLSAQIISNEISKGIRCDSKFENKMEKFYKTKSGIELQSEKMVADNG